MGVVTGDTAHDHPDGGHPLKLGGKASAATPAAVTDGDRVDAYFDLNGRQVISLGTALPAGAAVIGSVGITSIPVVGAHANAWNAQAVGAGGTSTAVDCQYTAAVSAFGNASAATTITLQYAQDNVNFYDGPNQVLGAAGNFRIDAQCGARYVRLKSSAATTITATIAGKMG